MTAWAYLWNFPKKNEGKKCCCRLWTRGHYHCVFPVLEWVHSNITTAFERLNVLIDQSFYLFILSPLPFRFFIPKDRTSLSSLVFHPPPTHTHTPLHLFQFVLLFQNHLSIDCLPSTLSAWICPVKIWLFAVMQGVESLFLNHKCLSLLACLNKTHTHTHTHTHKSNNIDRCWHIGEQ